MDIAGEFLLRHQMHPEQFDFCSVISDFQEEMKLGNEGKPSSLGMFPAYINATGQPVEGKVLVIDAGGTNLRLARLRYEQGELITEAVKKLPMPGTHGTISAPEFFLTVAAELLPLCDEVERGCFCFSYPSEVLSDGDAVAVRLTKELSVEGLPGMKLGANLEAALQKLGAKGQRRWRVINDTVGAMLCGMAQVAEPYDDYVGFILGTGYNMCANLASVQLTKAPQAAELGESCIVNFESGGFNRFPRGTADLRLDAQSDAPGAQLVEKCISGAYMMRLLHEVLLLAAEEGLFSQESAAILRALPINAALVSDLVDNSGRKLVPELPDGDYALLCELDALLLERAARLTACLTAGAILTRQLPAGSRVCLCADGTTFELNPILKPRTAYWMNELLRPSGVSVDIFQVRDATLLGTAYAALLP